MLGLALVFLIIGVWIFSIIDIVGTPADQVRVLPKLVWLVVVVLLGPLATLAWFLFGRPRATEYGYGGYDRFPASDHPAFGGRGPWGGQRPTTRGGQSGMSRAGIRRQETRPLGPDDDPEFLRELANRIRGGEAEPPARS